MRKALKAIKGNLVDNTGSGYLEQVILITIAFVCGGILWSIMDEIFMPGLIDGSKNIIQNIFNS